MQSIALSAPFVRLAFMEKQGSCKANGPAAMLLSHGVN